MDIKCETNDTIAAIATASGKGGVGIVRVSGPMALAIAKNILSIVPSKPRLAQYCEFKNSNAQVIDKGIAIFFKAPYSFTGEDVLELHGHGGIIVLDNILQQTLQLGARMARPGEFSERAFLNNKIDLLQAEAIADLINAKTTQASAAALRSLQGDFSSKIHNIVEELIQLRLYVEAAIDFPEEEIDFLSDKHVLYSLEQITIQVEKLLSQTKKGVLLSEGIDVVIAGAPNAGKSSLLNQLTGRDTAIVTPEAGTTRDKISVDINLDGTVVRISDTAGLRETDNIAELAGISRTEEALQKSDLVLLVIDGCLKNTNPYILHPELMKKIPINTKVVVVCNKIDKFNEQVRCEHTKRYTKVWISAKQGLGIDLLCEQIKKSVDMLQSGDSEFIARRRHLEWIVACSKHLQSAGTLFEKNKAGELLAEELRLAQQKLSEITGEFTSDELLGKIF